MDALKRFWPRQRDDTKAPERHRLGRRAEDLALEHLQGAGLVPVERNARAGRGEIDLILRDGDTLVFVEVRARAGGALVTAAESLSARKCAKVRETATRLLAARPEWQALYCRFDVIAVTATTGRQPKIDWLPDAF